ncbi:MAG: ATP-binding cassette domain-containing protein [Propionibacteriaceae bacterium]|nr:ATP-binding cassette domain-containing protein [Propionibacteriaceae bacterium]
MARRVEDTGPGRVALLETAAPLAAEDISFGYVPDRPVLRHVNHAFAAGSMTAITGRSGRGKSTLLYVLAGLLRPQEGVVRVAGESLYDATESWRCHTRATTFSFIFQDAALDAHRSVIDAVREPCLYAGVDVRRARERARALMASLGVEVDPDARPGQISGGQAQRIGVCRSLMLSPRVIFADEPTGNLDSESAAVVLRALASAAGEGAAILIATHDERVLPYCTDRLDLR